MIITYSYILNPEHYLLLISLTANAIPYSPPNIFLTKKRKVYVFLSYRGADKSLVQPGGKQVYVSVRMA